MSTKGEAAAECFVHTFLKVFCEKFVPSVSALSTWATVARLRSKACSRSVAWRHFLVKPALCDTPPFPRR